jgi:hypothetical protein
MEPLGIPIPPEVHQKFPEHVKQAWDTFHSWYSKQETTLIKRASMPRGVREAFETIKATPIPSSPGKTGADSCYVIGVENRLV